MIEKYKYRNYFLVVALVSFLLSAVDYGIVYLNSIVNLILDSIFLLGFIFGYLGYRNRIVLIGMAIAFIEWNIDILINPIVGIVGEMPISPNVYTLIFSLSVISILCLILGILDFVKFKALKLDVKLNSKIILGALFVFSIVFQIVTRY